MVDDFVRGVGAHGRRHSREIDRRRPPGNQLGPLVRQEAALVAAVPCVVVLVAVHHHVRLGHRSRVRVFLGGFGHGHALGEALPDARVGGRHGPIGRAEILHVREQDAAKQVSAVQERRRRNPGATAGPPGHVGRIEQRLAQAGRHTAEIRDGGHFAESHLLVGGDHQLHGALDLRGERRRAVEIAREKDPLQERLHLIPAVAIGAAQLRLERVVDLVANKEPIHLGGDELGGDGPRQDDVDDVLAVERARPAEKRLRAKVVLLAIELELQHVVRPPRERTRRLANVALAVVAHAHREELEQLAAEVLVGMRLDVLAVVEEHEHRRILQKADEQLAEISRRARAKHLVLPEHHPVVAHLVRAGREVAVPEQRELLLERPPGRHHAVRPPETKALRLDAVRGQAVEELVDDGLEPALRAFREHFFAEPLAALAGNSHRLRPARRERIHAGIPDDRLVEGFQAARDGLVVDQLADDPLGRQGRETRDFLGRGAKTGALDEMRGALGAPVAGRDGREVAGPARRPGRVCRGRRADGRDERRDHDGSHGCTNKKGGRPEMTNEPAGHTHPTSRYRVARLRARVILRITRPALRL